MPKSFVQLLAEWRNRDLEEFRNYAFPPGNNSLAQAYKKCKYLFDTIAAGQGGQQGMLALEQSARALDGERGGLSLAAFYRQRHDNDDNVVGREKRRRPNPAVVI